MKRRPTMAGGSLLLAALLIVLAPGPAAGWAPSAAVPPQAEAMPPRVAQAPAYQLLTNSSLEYYDLPYDNNEGADCQVASGWQRFWYDGPEPHWIDCRVFAASPLGGGWVEAIDGATSQMIVSTEPYTAGLWQQVSGLTPGVGYGFHAALLTIFQTSAQDPVPGTMFKEVGIDPTGGTDPLAPQVVWSEPNGQDHGWDVERVTATFSQAPTMTVFIRITSPHPSGGLPMLNQSFLDSAILARTATVSAVSPAVSGTQSFQVRWDNAIPTPDGQIRWYDVQWLDEADGIWHDWLTRTTDLSATFQGQWGHRYRFRARVWQRYPNGAHLFSPYRAEGDTQTRVGPELRGQVLNPWGGGLPGATVTISRTEQVAETGAGGSFVLGLASPAGPVSVTVSHPAWDAPPPVVDLTLAPTATLALTWTMRPPADAVLNGDFEQGLAGWSSTPGAVSVVSDTVHTGHGAAVLAAEPEPQPGPALGPGAPLTGGVGLSQTVVLTDAWEPALAFWYQAGSAAEEGGFHVVLTVVTGTLNSTLRAPGPLTSTVAVTSTRVLTPPLGATGTWLHFWSAIGAPQVALTGTVTVEFRLNEGGSDDPPLLYLDEVRLAATPGGPWRLYLPLLAREW